MTSSTATAHDPLGGPGEVGIGLPRLGRRSPADHTAAHAAPFHPRTLASGDEHVRNTDEDRPVYEPSGGYRAQGSRWRSLGLVLAVHALVAVGLAGFGAVAARHIEEERLTVFNAAAPSPEQPAPPQPDIKLEPVPQTDAPQAVIPKIQLNSAAPVQVAQISAVPPAAAVAIAAPPGPPAPAPAPPAPITPPDFSAGQLDNPGPSYPYKSRRNREEGTVLLKVLVSAEGKADTIEINETSGFERLDAEAIKTVRKWRFVPAKQAGKAVSAWVIVPVSFFLS